VIRSSRGRNAESERAGRDRWLIAYADMITLLLACFAAMYAARLNFVPPKPEPLTLASPVPAVVPTESLAPALDQLKDVVDRLVLRGGIFATLNVTTDPRGLVISLPESGSFPTGSAELTAEGQAIITELGHALEPTNAPIRVEGHTDDVPIHTAAFASNWELSAVRATHVVEFLIDHCGVSAERLSAAGYGEFHPVEPNASSDARGRNRRVDVVVLSPSAARAEEPPRPAGASAANGASGLVSPASAPKPASGGGSAGGE
jgi:chemotaxis protein MotB